jgi:hypothetical protein
MNPAAFKLECFQQAPRADAVTHYDRRALDRAYQNGLAEGLRQQQHAEFHALLTAIEGLCRSLQEDDSRRSAIQHETVASFAPILTEILGTAFSQGESRRVEQALRHQLTLLIKASPERRLRIFCPEALRPMVDEVLTSLPGAPVEATTAASKGVEIVFEGGRTELSPQRVASQISDILRENLNLETTWTSCNS